jgi:hypothetical protein
LAIRSKHGEFTLQSRLRTDTGRPLDFQRPDQDGNPFVQPFLLACLRSKRRRGDGAKFVRKKHWAVKMGVDRSHQKKAARAAFSISLKFLSRTISFSCRPTFSCCRPFSSQLFSQVLSSPESRRRPSSRRSSSRSSFSWPISF